MKNLTKSLIAASMLIAGSALAVDDVSEGSGEVKVTGHVPVKCTVEVGEGNIDLEHNPTQGEVYGFSGDIAFTCNNKAGANVDLTSANSGLANQDSPEHVIDYSAWLELVGLEQPTMGGIGGNFVELVCKESSCNSNTLMTGQKDTMLAMGAVSGVLTVSITEDIKFAGFYNDTMTVAIAAKL